MKYQVISFSANQIILSTEGVLLERIKYGDYHQGAHIGMHKMALL